MKRKCYLSNEARTNGLTHSREVCLEKFIKRQEEYKKCPNKCCRCNIDLDYKKRHNKFCSRSCSATINNYGVRRNVSVGTFALKPCCYCGTTTKFKCCSKECSIKLRKEKRWNLIKENDNLINYRQDKDLLIETRGRKCEICFITTWNGVDVPLVLDHINGNSDDNSLNNVRLICHNCNALTSTFCGRNKGNGRHSKRGSYRNKRYSEGKSY